MNSPYKKFILGILLFCGQLNSEAQKLELGLLVGTIANHSERLDYQLDSYPSQVGFSSSAFIDLSYWPKTSSNLHYFLGVGYIRLSQVHSFKGHPFFSIDSKIPKPTFHLNGANINLGIRLSLINSNSVQLMIGTGIGIIITDETPIYEGVEGMFKLEDVGSGRVRDVEYFTSKVTTNNIALGPVSDVSIRWALSNKISLGFKIQSFLSLHHLATTAYNYRINSPTVDLTHLNFTINKGDYIAGLISVNYQIFER